MVMTSTLSERGLAAFSVSQSVLSNEGMKQDLDLVVEAGIGAVAILGRMAQEAGVAATAALLAERNLAVSSYICEIGILDLGFDTSVAALLSDIEAAAGVGAPVILLITGALGARAIRDADDEVVARLQAVSAQARGYGVTLGLEPVNPFLRTVSYVHTLSHAADIVSRVAGAGLVLDVAHVYWDRHLSTDVAANASRICLAQLTNLSESGIARATVGSQRLGSRRRSGRGDHPASRHLRFRRLLRTGDPRPGWAPGLFG